MIRETLPAVHLLQQPSRFERRRQEAAERGALELAASDAERARDACQRAAALFKTASGSDPGPRADALESALGSMRAAHAILSEILGELT